MHTYKDTFWGTFFKAIALLVGGLLLIPMFLAYFEPHYNSTYLSVYGVLFLDMIFFAVLIPFSSTFVTEKSLPRFQNLKAKPIVLSIMFLTNLGTLLVWGYLFSRSDFPLLDLVMSKSFYPMLFVFILAWILFPIFVSEKMRTRTISKLILPFVKIFVVVSVSYFAWLDISIVLSSLPELSQAYAQGVQIF